MKIGNWIRRIVRPLQVPLVKWYLHKQRNFSYGSIRVTVFPGIFHPGLFLSTEVLLDFIGKMNIKGLKMLELGCGTATISVYAASKGAIVTASDINPRAVENAKHNADANKVHLRTVQSDLFQAIPERFDLIIINPPYYPHQPKSELEIALMCGENFEYFEKLFSQLSDHVLPDGTAFMILSEDCDLPKINTIAGNYGCGIKLVEKRRVGLEDNFIFSIQIKP